MSLWPRRECVFQHGHGHRSFCAASGVQNAVSIQVVADLDGHPSHPVTSQTSVLPGVDESLLGVEESAIEGLQALRSPTKLIPKIKTHQSQEATHGRR